LAFGHLAKTDEFRAQIDSGKELPQSRIQRDPEPTEEEDHE
jgi:hypothetical protein